MPAEPSTGARTVVAHVDELPPGAMKFVPVGKYGVGVYNVGGVYTAIANYCPHRGGPMCFGYLTGEVSAGPEPYSQVYGRQGELIKCPWHGWEYELVTGQAVAERARVRTHRVEVENDHVILIGVS